VEEIADLLDLGASEADRSEIPEDKVVVGALGLKLVALRDESLSEGLRVGDDLLGVLLPLGRRDLLEGSGDGGNSLGGRL